jgi:hypothetical protein
MKVETPKETELLGYRHPEYALSLVEYGRPRELEKSGGWLLERSIPGTAHRDAMGLYPLFHCRDWHGLPDDLQTLRQEGLISLVVVSILPRAELDLAVFNHFDVVRPFKTHYLADLGRLPDETASRHHRYHARKAAKVLEVDVPGAPLAYLDEWCMLYSAFASRLAISDLRVFSRVAFERLLAIPGVILFRALRHGQPVGAQIILIQDDVAFAHLAAFTEEGYKCGASYFLDRHAMEYLRGRASYLNWGGGTGLEDADQSGLARYKQGWSTERRTAYLLGAVLDRAVYERLNARVGRESPTYFPRYRAGEFG